MRRVTTATLIALGFLLGMRHATDADHVIAVSTIVTRQGRLRAGILIGGLWGVGHTLTIAVIGGAIILFRVVIPPAVGLTMEMTVALMLVVLGTLESDGPRAARARPARRERRAARASAPARRLRAQSPPRPRAARARTP